MFILSLTAGAALGILSAFGIGGGTLLILYMTLIAGLQQNEAQGINLFYFIPTALAALPSHLKDGLIKKNIFLWAAASGVISAIGTSLLANTIETELLQKIFGGFLILTGLWQLFRKAKA